MIGTNPIAHLPNFSVLDGCRTIIYDLSSKQNEALTFTLFLMLGLFLSTLLYAMLRIEKLKKEKKELEIYAGRT